MGNFSVFIFIFLPRDFLSSRKEQIVVLQFLMIEKRKYVSLYLGFIWVFVIINK